MRLKEFLICVGVFTILYILFFVILDFMRKGKEKGRVEKRMSMIMDGERFFQFAQFYGIQTRLSPEQLNAYYDYIRKNSNFSISMYAREIQLSPYEVVVIVLYFEYFLLIEKKTISMKEDLVKRMTVGDEGYTFRFGPLFLEKLTVEQIVERMGQNALQDLNYIQEYFLAPGVRLWENKLYYLEGVDIHA